jgi:hypothetical protein
VYVVGEGREPYELGDEPRAALEGQLVDLGLVLVLVFRLVLGRHGGCGLGRRAMLCVELREEQK